jgi:GNAT superfamily N-acetyltransferase
MRSRSGPLTPDLTADDANPAYTDTCDSSGRLDKPVPMLMPAPGPEPRSQAVTAANEPAEPRQATEADLPSIQRVIAAAYAKYLSRMGKPPAPLSRDYRAAVDAGAVWVAGRPVTGVISLTPKPDVILIENVAVHPARQGTGLGRRLMEFAEQQARQRNIGRLSLYTNELMTENQALYAHLGYRETERRVEDGYRRIYMEKVLPAS